MEAVGPTYIACAGLKFAEKKFDTNLLNKHHAVRATDFGTSLVKALTNVKLKNGRPLQINIGIHTGPVISGVVGETKP